MKYCIIAKVTPQATAKLLLTREMDLSNFISNTQIDKVWDCLLSMSVEEILHIIDCNRICQIADVKDIPQYGKLETIKKVPYYFKDRGSDSAEYAQMGFYLKNDINASLGANVKFGENHGKGADLLGIVKRVDTKFVPSILTQSFCSLSDEEQKKVLVLLQFRIPIVQILLQNSKQGKISGYEPMKLASESTQKRRGQCLKAIFKSLKSLNSKELDDRIDNIMWD